MSKFEELNLPELPENRRWRLTKDTLINSPKLLLEEKTWWGWRTVRDRYLSCDVWPTIEECIRQAALVMMRQEESAAEAVNYLGASKP